VEAAMASFGRVDILVNNAGLTWGAPTLEYPMDKWEKVINVNLRASFYLSKLVANIMVKQKSGKIINITSVYGYRGTSEDLSPAIAYNASKGGQNILTLDLAVKLAKHNINVNGIAPGYYGTDLINYAKEDEAVMEKMIKKIPAGRLGVEDDIKGAAVFLASDAANYLNGHIMAVDGGYLAW
jgi:gluconate 5-dehydrogenase